MLLIGLGIACVLVLPGLVLIWLSSAATVTDRTCTCGYDLAHLAPRTSRCPECGRARRHVTIRHPRLLFVGIALVLLPFVLAVVAGAILLGFLVLR